MNRVCEEPEHDKIEPIENHIVLDLSDTGVPRFIVNGVDIAPMISNDWQVRRAEDAAGVPRTYFDVTFEVMS